MSVKESVYVVQTYSILIYLDNDFEIESKYHRKTVVLLLIAHILSLQDVVLRSMLSLICILLNCLLVKVFDLHEL